MPADKPLTFITIQGTTASGKSSLALQLAELMAAEIISADSRQIYKFMDIGTAKPTLEERSRVKHHLVDIITPDQSYNAGRFARDASNLIKKLNENDKIPIVTGGTGFYIKALQEGLAQIPEIPSKRKTEIRRSFSSMSDVELHKQLKSCDPVSASRINHQDRQKLLRAISVYEYTGKPISFFWQQQAPGKNIKAFNILISRPREEIYKRINDRVDLMQQKGLLEEVKMLLNKGYSLNDPGLRSVGYQEIVPYFTEETNLQDCIELVKQHTRNYAKRQITWLKKYQFDLTLDQTNITFLQISKEITEFLRST